MTPFGIEYSIHGVPQIEHVLVGIGARALDGAPVLWVILADMRKLERELFDTEGRGEWPELSPTTIARKAELGYPDAILQATEGLYDSLTGTGGEAGHVEYVTAEEVVYGTTNPNAHWHQDGTRKMPARPPIDVRELDLRRWSKAIHEYVFGLDAAEVSAAGGGGIPFGMASTDPFGVG